MKTFYRLGTIKTKTIKEKGVYYITEKTQNWERVTSEDNEPDTIDFMNMIGGIQKKDIGKKVVRNEKGNWSIENDEQFNKRINQ